MTNIANFLSEVHRVLTSNGIFITVSYGTPENRLCYLEKVRILVLGCDGFSLSLIGLLLILQFINQRSARVFKSQAKIKIPRASITCTSARRKNNDF